MNAVLIVESVGGRDLEIDIEIEEIPPIGFEYVFSTPSEIADAYLYAKVTGYDQWMKQSGSSSFVPAQPVKIFANVGCRTDGDKEILRKYLGRQ